MSAIIPFHNLPFTSTLHDESHKSSVNLWIIMITAMFFFLILSWYNFIVAAYDYLFNINNTRRDDNDVLRENLFSSLGFAILWTVLSVLVYLFLDSYGLLSRGDSIEYEHPSVEDKVSDVGII